MARKYEEVTAKPTNDAYTGMLAISFVALLVGCALLYLDYDQYSNKVPDKLNVNVKSRPAPDVAGKPAPKEGEKKEGEEGKEGEKKDMKVTPPSTMSWPGISAATGPRRWPRRWLCAPPMRS